MYDINSYLIYSLNIKNGVERNSDGYEFTKWKKLGYFSTKELAEKYMSIYMMWNNRKKDDFKIEPISVIDN